MSSWTRFVLFSTPRQSMRCVHFGCGCRPNDRPSWRAPWACVIHVNSPCQWPTRLTSFWLGCNVSGAEPPGCVMQRHVGYIANAVRGARMLLCSLLRVWRLTACQPRSVPPLRGVWQRASRAFHRCSLFTWPASETRRARNRSETTRLTIPSNYAEFAVFNPAGYLIRWPVIRWFPLENTNIQHNIQKLK